MASLFGEGLHPNADTIRAQLMTLGSSAEHMKAAREATSLGKPYEVLDTAPAFRVAVARRAVKANNALGVPRDTPLAAAERARIRTDVGRADVRRGSTAASRRTRGSCPGSSPATRGSRPARSPGIDLTFSPVKSVSALWAIAPPAGRRADRGGARRRGRRHPGLARNGGASTPAAAATGCSRWTPPAWSPRRSTTATPAPGTRTCTPTSRSRTRSASGPIGRAVARPGRAGAVQGHRRRVGAVQHPPRGRAARAGSG